MYKIQKQRKIRKQKIATLSQKKIETSRNAELFAIVAAFIALHEYTNMPSITAPKYIYVFNDNDDIVTKVNDCLNDVSKLRYPYCFEF